MARASRTARQLTLLVWTAAPWLILGALLLGIGLLGHGEHASDVSGTLRAATIVGALAAPFAAAAIDPRSFPPGRGPRPLAVLATFLLVMVGLAYLFEQFVLSRANAFYTAALVAEGTLLLLVLHAIQAIMRHFAGSPGGAGPRAADALIDGVRFLLLLFLAFTLVAFRPPAAVALLLALGFAFIAILMRVPGVMARLARPQ